MTLFSALKFRNIDRIEFSAKRYICNKLKKIKNHNTCTYYTIETSGEHWHRAIKLHHYIKGTIFIEEKEEEDLKINFPEEAIYNVWSRKKVAIPFPFRVNRRVNRAWSLQSVWIRFILMCDFLIQCRLTRQSGNPRLIEK